MTIAIIPARGGSKRIPRKNIKEFSGAPIISYSIKAAIKSDLFEHIIVSTDDEEIAKIAKEYGAEVPFLRPDELSDDFTGTDDVVIHTIEWCQKQSWPVTNICCIYATAPFIFSADISSAYEILLKKKKSYVFSATTYAFPVERAFQINNAGEIQMLFPDKYHTRSQDLKEMYHDAGQFYWGKPEVWLERKEIFSSDSEPYILPRIRVQDIDTIEDWETAELLYETMQRE